jgi:hypothetical protein
VAALLAVGLDAPGQPDQGRVAGADVADPQLGLGQVEQGIPAGAVQHPERDQQRDGEHGEQAAHHERGMEAAARW